MYRLNKKSQRVLWGESLGSLGVIYKLFRETDLLVITFNSVTSLTSAWEGGLAYCICFNLIVALTSWQHFWGLHWEMVLNDYSLHIALQQQHRHHRNIREIEMDK